MTTKRDPVATRQRIMQASYEEMHKHGYQGMRVDVILNKTGLKKGAFYHHFRSKQALGYAVLDEIIREFTHNTWVEPMRQSANPIEALKQIFFHIQNSMDAESLKLGCPLNNLAQEMSPIDDGFRERTQAIFSEWQEGFAISFKKGKESGYIRNDVDEIKVAKFLIAAIEGCRGLAKNSQDKGALIDCAEQIIVYLDSLRAN